MYIHNYTRLLFYNALPISCNCFFLSISPTSSPLLRPTTTGVTVRLDITPPPRLLRYCSVPTEYSYCCVNNYIIVMLHIIVISSNIK